MVEQLFIEANEIFCPFLFVFLHKNGIVSDISTSIGISEKYSLYIPNKTSSKYPNLSDFPEYYQGSYESIYNPESIEYLLMKDNIDAIKQAIKDINTAKKVFFSPFEYNNTVNSCDYLSFAAFYGSLKCFYYLLSLGHLPNVISFEYSIIGGNTGVFSECYKMVGNYKVLQSCIKFHRFNFFSMIYEDNKKMVVFGHDQVCRISNYHEGYQMVSIKMSFKYHNTIMSRFCYEHGDHSYCDVFNPFQDDSQYYFDHEQYSSIIFLLSIINKQDQEKHLKRFERTEKEMFSVFLS